MYVFRGPDHVDEPLAVTPTVVVERHGGYTVPACVWRRGEDEDETQLVRVPGESFLDAAKGVLGVAAAGVRLQDVLADRYLCRL